MQMPVEIDPVFNRMWQVTFEVSVILAVPL
jgi:hypothetical protein